MSRFSPPGRLERWPVMHPLFGRLSIMRGVSLLKESGVYRQTSEPLAEEITAAEITYLGGHVYEITSAEALALMAAGYGSWLVFDVYGSGVYGAGTYGGI